MGDFSLIVSIILLILSLVLLYFSIVFLVQVPRSLMDIDTTLTRIAKIMEKQYRKYYDEKIEEVAKKLNEMEKEDID